jgi:hypothetical protein
MKEKGLSDASYIKIEIDRSIMRNYLESANKASSIS